MEGRKRKEERDSVLELRKHQRRRKKQDEEKNFCKGPRDHEGDTKSLVCEALKVA